LHLVIIVVIPLYYNYCLSSHWNGTF